MSPKDWLKVEKAINARTYLKTLGDRHNELVANEKKEPGFVPYDGHPIQLNYSGRRKVADRLFQDTFHLATGLKLTKAQHQFWCTQTVDFQFAAARVMILAAMNHDDSDIIRSVLELQMVDQSTVNDRLKHKLITKDPFVGYTATYGMFYINASDHEICLKQRENHHVTGKWMDALTYDCGLLSEAIDELRVAINQRFKKYDQKARLLLQPLADEMERLMMEAMTYGLALAIDTEFAPHAIPALSYWPLYPNSGVSRNIIAESMKQTTHPQMLELMPDLIKGNITNREIMVPTVVHLTEVFWLVEQLKDITLSLTDAFKSGTFNQLIPTFQNFTPEVRVFTRDTATPDKQARISFGITSNEGQEITIRLDREDDGKFTIDFGNSNLEVGLRYATASSNILANTSTTYQDHFDDQGNFIEKDGAATLKDLVRVLHDSVDANERLAIISGSLSNLGFMVTVRQNSVISHHRHEHEMTRFSSKEFSDCVKAFRKAMLKT